MPVHPPAACSTRAAMSASIVGATRHRRLPRTNSTMPVMITGRRPNWSDIGPQKSWEMATAMKKADIESWISPAVAENTAIIPASDGR